MDNGWLSRDWPRLRAESDELLHLDLLGFIAAAGVVLCHSGEFLVQHGPVREAMRSWINGIGAGSRVAARAVVSRVANG